jgi:drug/metabolite transporter (DMT)-like permease
VSSRRWLPSYVALAAIWGCSFLFIKVGLESLTPAGVTLSRLVFGLATMLVISAMTRTRLPHRTTWLPIFLAAALMTSLPWTLFAFGEERVSSALAGVINGATPLMTLVAILIAFPEERPTRERIAGLLIGFLGVVVVVGPWQGSGSAAWLGIAACVAAISCYGISFPYVRRRLAGGARAIPLPPIALATGLMLMGTLQTVPIAVVTGVTTAPVTTSVVLAMLALGCLGSGIAYILNFRVIAASDATTASTVTYLTPLVAVIVGAVVLGEHVSWNQPVGGVLVVLGAATAQGLVTRRRRRAATEAGASPGR